MTDHSVGNNKSLLHARIVTRLLFYKIGNMTFIREPFGYIDSLGSYLFKQKVILKVIFFLTEFVVVNEWSNNSEFQNVTFSTKSSSLVKLD